MCRLSHWTAEFFSLAIELTHGGKVLVSAVPSHVMNAAQMLIFVADSISDSQLE